MCTAEDLLGRVMYANKASIDKANNSTITQMNGFLEDIKSQLGLPPENPQRLPDVELPEGAIISQNDEEVLNLSRGGSDYVTAEGASTYWHSNINPGITTSPGRGATVNVGVSTGGLGSSSGGSIGYSWVNNGTGYTNQNAIDCTIVGSGSGSGMKVNLITAGGEITNIFTHTAGTNYTDNTLLRIDSGNFDAQFTLDEVYGPVNPGAITIVNRGSKYQSGDVIGVVGGDNLATFTVTQANDPGGLDEMNGKSKSLSDIIGLIGNLGGNISAALNFENMKTNIFPFELPANPAVSDFYQLGKGGSGAEAGQMPSFGAVGNFVDKVETIAKEAIESGDPSIILDKIPKPESALAFIKPSLGEPPVFFNPKLGENVDTMLDELKDTAGNLIDKNGNLLKT